MKTHQLDNDRWIMSFYRNSEISGAMFFGRLASFLPAGPIQEDLTQHFADESMHASYWTKAIYELGLKPDRIRETYQGQYFDAVGFPVNIMEILALTNVFERRVISQYAKHLRVPDLNPTIARTLRIIMEDEKWHIEWIGKALRCMELTYGKEHIDKTINLYREADKDVYGKTVAENEERLAHIIYVKSKSIA